MSGTASFGKAHLAVHSETQVGGYSLGLSHTDPKPEELKKELTEMNMNKQSNIDMKNRSSAATNVNLPTWRASRWLLTAVLMVPLV
jgi:hypothetical protein